MSKSAKPETKFVENFNAFIAAVKSREASHASSFSDEAEFINNLKSIENPRVLSALKALGYTPETDQPEIAKINNGEFSFLSESIEKLRSDLTGLLEKISNPRLSQKDKDSADARLLLSLMATSNEVSLEKEQKESVLNFIAKIEAMAILCRDKIIYEASRDLHIAIEKSSNDVTPFQSLHASLRRVDAQVKVMLEAESALSRESSEEDNEEEILVEVKDKEGDPEKLTVEIEVSALESVFSAWRKSCQDMLSSDRHTLTKAEAGERDRLSKEIARLTKEQKSKATNQDETQ